MSHLIAKHNAPVCIHNCLVSWQSPITSTPSTMRLRAAYNCLVSRESRITSTPSTLRPCALTTVWWAGNHESPRHQAKCACVTLSTVWWAGNHESRRQQTQYASVKTVWWAGITNHLESKPRVSRNLWLQMPYIYTMYLHTVHLIIYCSILCHINYLEKSPVHRATRLSTKLAVSYSLQKFLTITLRASTHMVIIRWSELSLMENGHYKSEMAKTE